MLVCCEEAGPEPIDELLGTTLRTDVAEPNGGRAAGEPLPLGFDTESWREYLIGKISTGQQVTIGGVEVIVAEMDEPLFYEGARFTMRQFDVETEEEGVSGAPARGPDVGVDYDMWDQRWGGGLAFGRDSGVEVTGCRDTGDWTFGAGWGQARFQGPISGYTAEFPLLVPNRSCAFSLFAGHQTVSTWYAKNLAIPLGPLTFRLWLVYKPETWKSLGTDAWKQIRLEAHPGLGKDRLRVHGVGVTHNDQSTTDPAIVFSPPLFELGAPPDGMDLDERIRLHKRSLTKLATIDSPVLSAAVDDYAQNASTKYPVFLMDDTWNGMQLPRSWCSEFASWAIRAGAPSIWPPPPMPTVDPWNPSIGVAAMYEWANHPWVKDRLSFFGDNHGPLPSTRQNGATDEEWAGLQYGVQPGDYVARWHEIEDPENPGQIIDTGHSQFFVGWLSDDETSIGPQYFDPNRPCNLFWEVGGNQLGPGIQGSGLGSIVYMQRRVMCQRPNLDASGNPILGSDGFWEDPPQSPIPLPGTCLLPCNVRLYDRRPFLPDVFSPDLKAGFIVRTGP